MMSRDVFKQIRINEGMSQCEYAKALDMSQTFISMMENGHQPISDKTRRKVAARFKVTPEIMEQVNRSNNLLQ